MPQGCARLHLGEFSDEVSAAHAYDRIARRLLGDEARLNFHPETGEELLGMMACD